MTHTELAWEFADLFAQMPEERLDEMISKNVPDETLAFFRAYATSFGQSESLGSETVERLPDLLLVGALLFGIGMAGFLSRRNMIVMFLCVEMMLQGVSVSLVAWSRYHNDWGGQMLVIFILTVAACEAAIALAVVPISFLLAGLGMAIRAGFPEIAAEMALPTAVSRLVPVGLAGLIVAGFVAAIMSSADTTLISASTSIR